MEVGSSNLASPLQFQAFDTLDLPLLALETPVEVLLSPPPKSRFQKALETPLKTPKPSASRVTLRASLQAVRPVNLASRLYGPYTACKPGQQALRAVYSLQTSLL